MGEEKILPMKPNERLAKTIALGRNRFILFRGVLGLGLLVDPGAADDMLAVADIEQAHTGRVAADDTQAG